MTRVGAALVTGAAVALEAVLFTSLAHLAGGGPPAIPDLALIMVWGLVYSIPFALVLAFLLPELGRITRRESRAGWFLSGALLGALLGLAGSVTVVRSPLSAIVPVTVVAVFGATAGTLLHILLRPGSGRVTPVTPPDGTNP